jgi:hypothetical protein
MGFGLVIGFIGLLQIVTPSYYRAITNSHIQQFTTACIKSSQSTVSYWLSGNGFQRYSFLTFRVQQLLSLLAGGYLTSQLGIAWSQSSNKGYSSRAYSSWTAFPNCCLKTPDSYDYTITHRLVFPVTVFTAVLCSVFQSGCPASGLTSLQAGGLQLTWLCCAMAYSNGSSSASHSSTKGDCLSLGLSQTACFWTQAQLD